LFFRFAGYAQGGAVSYKTPPSRKYNPVRPGLRIIDSNFMKNTVFGSAAPASADQASSSGGAVVITILGNCSMEQFDILNSTFFNNSCQTPCGKAFGAALAASFIPLIDSPVHPAYTPIRIFASRFEDNRVVAKCEDDSVGHVAQALGGALSISVPAFWNTSAIVTESRFVNNSAHAPRSAGGAIHFETLGPAAVDKNRQSGSLSVSVVDSSFNFNGLRGVTAAAGGAIHIVGVKNNLASLKVANVSFLFNSARCALFSYKNGFKVEPCFGGALSVEYGLIQVTGCYFRINIVGDISAIDGKAMRTCGASAGGAIASFSSVDIIDVSNSTFDGNFAKGTHSRLMRLQLLAPVLTYYCLYLILRFCSTRRSYLWRERNCSVMPVSGESSSRSSPGCGWGGVRGI
jgi:hypothetical protein